MSLCAFLPRTPCMCPHCSLCSLHHTYSRIDHRSLEARWSWQGTLDTRLMWHRRWLNIYRSRIGCRHRSPCRSCTFLRHTQRTCPHRSPCSPHCRCSPRARCSLEARWSWQGTPDTRLMWRRRWSNIYRSRNRHRHRNPCRSCTFPKHTLCTCPHRSPCSLHRKCSL